MEPEETSRPYALRFTQRALHDMDSAHAHFMESAGAEVADEWRIGLLDAVATLATMPRRQEAAPESRRFKQEVRQLIYRRRLGSVAYRILFTIHEESGGDPPMVLVIHLRHGAARPITRAEARELEAEE